MQSLEQFAEPSIEVIPQFMTTLEKVRQETAFQAWCDYTRKSPLLRKWRYFLAIDPYTRWGLVKPRGYPGDATLMDYAYGHPSIMGDVQRSGSLAQDVYRHTAGALQSASARLRIELIAEKINSLSTTADISLVSYASGHARELERLSLSHKGNIKSFTAIDADAQSLQEAARSAGDIAFEGHQRNVIKHSMDDLSKGDLVYSLGLFDYLDDHHATIVCSKMLAQTRPQGTVLLANLAPTAANLGYCEAIMDWWMITRSKEQLMRLAANACEGLDTEAVVTQHGCFNYLRLRLKS
ncbi:MAG: hypothetical protein ACK4F8_05570 [Aquabacterium sp.]